MKKKLLILSVAVLGFSSANAQVYAPSTSGANVSSATSNYQLLLEIRSLQRETAELRDRIDQQEFQLERLRDEQSRASASNPNQSIKPDLPKKVEQFDSGAVVEEIDLSSVPNNGNLPVSKPNESEARADDSVLAQEKPEPYLNRQPTLIANDTPQEVPAVGELGGVFGPLGGTPKTEEVADPLLEPEFNSQVTSESIAVEQPMNLPEQPRILQDGVFGPISEDSQVQLTEPINNDNVVPVFPSVVQPESVIVDSAPELTAPVFEPQIAQPSIQQPTQQPSAQDQLLENGDFGIKTQLGEEELYNNGLSELKKQDYEKAVSVLSAQLSQFPKGTRAPDAYYWIGESLYILERLNSAKKSYMSILNLFPDSRRVPNAIYKVAVIEYEQGNTPAAREAVQTLNSKYPNSSAAAQAKTRFENLL